MDFSLVTRHFVKSNWRRNSNEKDISFFSFYSNDSCRRECLCKWYEPSLTATFAAEKTSQDNASGETGLSIRYLAPIFDYSIKAGEDLGTPSVKLPADVVEEMKPYTFDGDNSVRLIGTAVELENNTDNIIVINTGKSSIKIDNFSGLPFVPGMKYNDQNNPSAIPPIIVGPHQSLQQEIMLPCFVFDDEYAEWDPLDAPEIPVSGSLNITLYLNVQDSSGEKYVTTTSPNAILVPSKKQGDSSKATK